MCESESKEFKCAKCNIVFKTRTELQVHKEKHHPQIEYVHHK